MEYDLSKVRTLRQVFKQLRSAALDLRRPGVAFLNLPYGSTLLSPCHISVNGLYGVVGISNFLCVFSEEINNAKWAD